MSTCIHHRHVYELCIGMTYIECRSFVTMAINECKQRGPGPSLLIYKWYKYAYPFLGCVQWNIYNSFSVTATTIDVIPIYYTNVNETGHASLQIDDDVFILQCYDFPYEWLFCPSMFIKCICLV